MEKEPTCKMQENCSSEPCKSTLKTPLKQSATSHSVLGEIQSNSGPLTTPPKLKEIPLGDPWTPTTNLKILISAASPEIRNREQKKGLQDSGSEILEAKHCLQEHLSGDEYEKSQPSRKEKSLGLLCHKFLARYPNYPITGDSNYICLDEVAEELTVERRRIYDIVNVLESLHMVSRLAKNRYAWHGRHNLSKTLQTLKKVGEDNKYMQQIQLIKKREYENEFELDGEKNEETATKTIGINEHSEMCFVELPGMEFRAASVNSRKDKSLRVMSQKFVMLFLVSTPQIVSLEVAAKILIGEDHVEDLDKSKFKTKIRRLYDIANVLSSLELIKKVHVTEERGRKPAFKWTGPEVLSDIQGTKPVSTVSTFIQSNSAEPKPSKEQCSKNLFPTRGKQIFTRHPSLMKLVKTIESDRRIHSAPTSPVKTSTTGCDQNSSTFPSKMAQLAAICKQQLEDQSSELKMRTKLSSNLECNLAAPESILKSETYTTSTSPNPSLVHSLGVLPLSHNSVSPVMLPHPHAGVSYTIYLHPSQAQTATTYSPNFVLQSLPCTNVTGVKTALEANSKVLCGKMITEEGDGNVVKDDTRNFLNAKETKITKIESTPRSFLKRSQALQENNLIKKCKHGQKSLGVSMGESVKNERPSSRALHMDTEVVSFQERGQIECENLDQNMECCCDKERREGFPEDQSKTNNTQERPVPFAVHAHEALFPSGYLIPIARCTQHSNETTFSNKEKAGICSLQPATYNSPITGVIPVTASELTAVNIPAFHVTPMNIMVSPSSIAAAPVVNSSCLNSGHTNSVQNPSSSILNFTLQHLGLIPASVQVSANPVLQSVPISPKAEHVNMVSENVNSQREKVLKNESQIPDCELNGKSVAAIPLQQQPSVPAKPKESQVVTENFFRTPGGPNTIASLSSFPENSDRAFQRTLTIPQRKLEVSDD
ncbi:PREDICTED: transcription factor E2F8 isoform X4 [Crocodylus porosus]|uniref:transcription factor E2F8 isoform X4 n=1 Tax=Crocodylus porosus TaxID=8502 RepID=UPI00093E0A77|nr:PREDICTED: transcription factor E2F8 isoform X4 [Crocodylus porosus]